MALKSSLLPALASRRRPQPAVPHRVLVVGHRGASAERPENTLAAVLRAHEVGADLVEVDVRMTRDGAVVLMHDESVARTTRGPGRPTAHDAAEGAPVRVGDLTLAQLRERETPDGSPVPLLADVLPLGPTLVDVKQPARYPGLVEQLAATLPRADADAGPAGGPGTGPGPVVVQSVDAAAMRTLARLRPDVPVAVLGRPRPEALAELATWASGVHVQHLRLDQGYVDRLHAHGLRCLTWTVNHPRMVERVLRLGVDGVITDRPRELVQRLA